MRKIILITHFLKVSSRNREETYRIDDNKGMKYSYTLYALRGWFYSGYGEYRYNEKSIHYLLEPALQIHPIMKSFNHGNYVRVQNRGCVIIRKYVEMHIIGNTRLLSTKDFLTNVGVSLVLTLYFNTATILNSNKMCSAYLIRFKE